MAGDNANPAAAPRQTFTKDYTLDIRFCENVHTYDRRKDWVLSILFQCHDLLGLMRDGLFWTASNIVPERGWIDRTTGIGAVKYPLSRRWELQELPDRPESECRWVASAELYAHSVKPLAEFRLHKLRRDMVSGAAAFNKDKHQVFNFDRLAAEHRKDFNCFVDNLVPSQGSWWFWPIEQETDGSDDETTWEEGKSETASLSEMRWMIKAREKMRKEGSKQELLLHSAVLEAHQGDGAEQIISDGGWINHAMQDRCLPWGHMLLGLLWPQCQDTSQGLLVRIVQLWSECWGRCQEDECRR